MAECSADQICCPPFDPEGWQEKELTWEEKRFVKDRVRCFLHIPLNFGGVMKRNMEKIEAAGAKAEEMIVLSDDNSLWGSDVYLDVSKDVPGSRMATISGRFLARVFEGPYSDMGKWMKEMKGFLASREITPKKMYTYYTTCPKCAKKYGKNYVVMLAQVD
jgi:hypothetical protein